MSPLALPMLPSRAAWIVLRNTRKRLTCRHQPVDEDGFGYIRCGRCRSWVLPR